MFVIGNWDDAFVTSMPFRAPIPPGVTKARWECGTIAICGYVPVFSVVCANTQGAVVCAAAARQGCESLFRSSRKPTLALVGFELEEYATSASLVSESRPSEYGFGAGRNWPMLAGSGIGGINPAREIARG